MNKQHLKKWGFQLGILLLLIVLWLALWNVRSAYAFMDEPPDPSNEYSRYPFRNYQLDFYVDNGWGWLPWNWGRTLGNQAIYALYMLTNGAWIISFSISYVTGLVVQEAFDLDFISQTADAIGQNIQAVAGFDRINPVTGFTQGFYGGTFLFILVILGFYVAYTGLLKRETTKAMRACLNFGIVFIVSLSFIAFSPTYIRNLNDFSRDMSEEALRIGTRLVLPQTSASGTDSTDLIRENLFGIQVKQPWLVLQFGSTDVEERRVEALRSSPLGTREREEVIIEEIEQRENFNLTVPEVMTRFALVAFLLFFNVGISLFVFLLTGMMIFSQLLFIIYATFLPISFLIGMIPGFESTSKKAVMRLFNLILLRSGITLVVTVAFSLSAMVYALSTELELNLFMMMFLQVVTFVGVYQSLGKILGLFTLQSGEAQAMTRQSARQVHRGARQAHRGVKGIVKKIRQARHAHRQRTEKSPSVPSPTETPLHNSLKKQSPRSESQKMTAQKNRSSGMPSKGRRQPLASLDQEKNLNNSAVLSKDQDLKATTKKSVDKRGLVSGKSTLKRENASSQVDIHPSISGHDPELMEPESTKRLNDYTDKYRRPLLKDKSGKGKISKDNTPSTPRSKDQTLTKQHLSLSRDEESLHSKDNPSSTSRPKERSLTKQRPSLSRDEESLHSKDNPPSKPRPKEQSLPKERPSVSRKEESLSSNPNGIEQYIQDYTQDTPSHRRLNQFKKVKQTKKGRRKR